MQIIYRPIKVNEYSFLKEMLFEALYVPEGQDPFPKSILEEPEIKKYIASWNQKDCDLALVALSGSELIGAIWGRRFEPYEKGYGFVDKHTPEISMAIKANYRGKRIGTHLLTQIEQEYIKMGITHISLSVDKRNPATKLYKKFGYRVYEEQNTSITMVKTLG